MQDAGSVRHVAREAGVSYDTFWNVMRGISSDTETVQKMIDKAKEIIANKPKEVIQL